MCGVNTEKTKNCFICGNKSHLSKDCPDKEKKSKCFSYGNFDHVASSCRNKNVTRKPEDTKTKARVDMMKSGDKKIYKTVICEKSVTAVIDSGSDLHLIRFDLYEQLNTPKMNPFPIRRC